MFLHVYGVPEADLWDWPNERYERHKEFARMVLKGGGDVDG